MEHFYGISMFPLLKFSSNKHISPSTGANNNLARTLGPFEAQRSDVVIQYSFKAKINLIFRKYKLENKGKSA
jgi:hypothetical protein